jgi:ABC-type Fe3+ transport system permease subunit
VLAFAALVVAFYAVIVVGAFTRVWGFDYTFTLQHLALRLLGRPEDGDRHADHRARRRRSRASSAC